MYLYVTRKVPLNNVVFYLQMLGYDTPETEVLFQLLINSISKH